MDTHGRTHRSHARVSALLAGIAQSRAGAAAEAAVWEDASSRWLASMQSRFSAYRDVVQPIMLAVSEIKHGIALATLAAAANIGDLPTEFESAATALLSFPAAHHELELLTSLALSGTAAAALTQSTGSAADTGDMPAHPSRAGDSADDLRVALLRSALVACADSSSRRGVNTTCLWARSRQLLARAADLWAQARSDLMQA